MALRMRMNMLFRHRPFISLTDLVFVLLISSLSSAATVTYTYDSLNRVTSVDYGNGFTENYTYDDAGNRLSMDVVSPDISTTPVSHDFLSVLVGNSSASQTITVSNTGTGDLIIGTIGLIGSNASEFSIQNNNCTNQTIAPLGSCTLNVIFSPTAGGAKNADLNVPSNDPDIATLSISLNGMGVTDTDGDGYTSDVDCNDNDPVLNPTTLWYPDNDGDSYGNATIYIQQCIQPVNYVLNSSDYNDNDPNINPAISPVRVAGALTLDYNTLQEAYNNAGNGDIIKVHSMTFSENIVININKTVTLRGGYNGTFTTNSGSTTLIGNINIINGTLVIENLVIEK